MQVYSCSVVSKNIKNTNKRNYGVVYKLGTPAFHYDKLIICKGYFDSVIFDHCGIWNAHCLN